MIRQTRRTVSPGAGMAGVSGLSYLDGMDETRQAQIDQAIGERVHLLMFRTRVRQGQLAAAIGIGQSGLSKKLHGLTPWTAAQVLLAADALGVDPDALLPRVDLVGERSGAPLPLEAQTA